MRNDIFPLHPRRYHLIGLLVLVFNPITSIDSWVIIDPNIFLGASLVFPMSTSSLRSHQQRFKFKRQNGPIVGNKFIKRKK